MANQIDIKEVLAYCHCPMYYYLKFKHTGKKDKLTSYLEKYDLDIHRTFYAFFSLVQNNEVARIESLKKSFGSLWIGKRGSEQVAATSQSSWRDSQNELRKRGIAALVRFYNFFKDAPGYPIAINQNYRVPITKDVILTGRWELIREIEKNKKRKMEVIKFKTDDKRLSSFVVDKDLELTAMAYAFEYAFERVPDLVSVYGVERGKLHQTKRTPQSYNFLKYTIDCVYQSIKKGLYPVLPGSKCSTCQYKDRCARLLNDEDQLDMIYEEKRKGNAK